MTRRTKRPSKTNSDTAEGARVAGYIRVSTIDQAESGLGLAAQRAALEAECERRGWTLTEVFADEGASGKSTKGRQALAAALDAVSSGAADALMVTKLDRLSRSLSDFSRIIDRAGDEGWNLVALDLAIDLSTPSGELVAAIMAASAQWERRVIGDRTKDALAQAKARGTRLGRPSTLDDAVRQRILDAHQAGQGFTAIARNLNADQVPTAASGKQWYPSTVRAVVLAA